MARLSKFVRNGITLAQGQAVTVGPEGDTFTLRTRGMTAEYADRLWALRRDAAIELNRTLSPGSVPYTPEQLPPSVDDRCVAQALSEKCLTGIEGLNGDDDTAVTLEEFNKLILQRENVALLGLAIRAAQVVGVESQAVQTEAEKNSETPSTGS